MNIIYFALKLDYNNINLQNLIKNKYHYTFSLSTTMANLVSTLF